jgi:hypothetical protein
MYPCSWTVPMFLKCIHVPELYECFLSVMQSLDESSTHRTSWWHFTPSKHPPTPQSYISLRVLRHWCQGRWIVCPSLNFLFERFLGEKCHSVTFNLTVMRPGQPRDFSSMDHVFSWYIYVYSSQKLRHFVPQWLFVALGHFVLM